MFGHNRKDDASPRKPQLVSVPKLEQLEVREVPALITNPDTYTVKAGTVLNAGQVFGVPGTGGQPPTVAGVLANDYSDTNPGIPITIQNTGFITAKYTNSKTPLPAKSLFMNADGSFYFIAPPDSPPNAGNVTFTYTATNKNDLPATGTVTIIIEPTLAKFVAVGADAGGGPHVRVYDVGTSVLRYNFFPYEQSFTGGVRVATGDVNQDGIDDIITIPNIGGGPRLRVFSGKDGSTLLDTFVFDPNFRGGGYVAVGDVNADGQKDIIIGAGEGGGPRVTVITLAAQGGKLPGPGNFTTLADFFAFDSNLQTGVRVAAGNLKALNRDFIITSTGDGVGSNPEVRVFDGANLLAGLAPQPVTKFFAFDGNITTGVNLSTGDFRGDGKFDIVVSTNDGPGIVRIFDGRNGGLVREFRVPVDETTTGTGTPLSGPTNFLFQNAPLGTLLSPNLPATALVNSVPGQPFPGVARGGVRISTIDWNSDGIDDIVVGAGPGNVSRVRIFNALDQSEIVNYLAFNNSFLGGVNVAGSV